MISLIELGSYAAYYTVGGFLNKTQDKVIKSLKNNYSRVCDYSLEEEQIKAWKDCLNVLKGSLSELPDSYNNLNIVFEYVLPQNKPGTMKALKGNTVRPDVLIISSDTVLVLEFKQHDDPFEGFFSQAKKYQTRIERYHAQSREMTVKSLLVLTKAINCSGGEDGVSFCSPDLLSEAILNALGETPKKHPNIQQWLDSEFAACPATPVTILPTANEPMYRFYTRFLSDPQHLYCYNTQTGAFFYMDHCWTGMGSWYGRDYPPPFSIVEINWADALKTANGNLNFPPDMTQEQYYGKFVEGASIFNPDHGYGTICSIELHEKEYWLRGCFKDGERTYILPNCILKGSVQLAV